MAIRPIMRYESINFLNTTPGTPETPTWALMNKGIESASVAYNSETDEKHYIADKTATKTVNSMTKELDVTQYAYLEDPTFEYIDDLFFNEAIGNDANTQILQVFLYKIDGVTAIPAKMSDVTIELGEHGGDGGAQLELAYNVLFTGDAVKGTVALVDGEPTFTAE